MTDTEIVYQDMRKHGSQGAWDWEADLRFARAIGASADLIQDCQSLLKSQAPFPLLIAFHRQIIRQPITLRRGRALRKLVRSGKAKSYWLGTGPYGRVEFGVNRVRHYELVD